MHQICEKINNRTLNTFDIEYMYTYIVKDATKPYHLCSKQAVRQRTFKKTKILAYECDRSNIHYTNDSVSTVPTFFSAFPAR